jgi:hypothetical protein
MTVTESDILAAKPYTETAAHPSIEDRANTLVDSMMQQLRTERALVYAIDDLPLERKQQIHARLFAIALVALRDEPLVEQPAPPDCEGEVYTVQPGGLLLSEQKPGESKP